MANKILERLFNDLKKMRIDYNDYRKLKKKYLGEPIHKLDRDKRYLCIKACGTTKDKIAKNDKNVTCKNCLRGMKKRKAGVRKR